MSPPYLPLAFQDGAEYFPAPYSLDPLPPDLQTGLIPVGILALLSVVATVILISFICFRLATWRLHYNTFLGYNQYVLLVLNLLLADLQQASAFLVSFHWIQANKILAPSSSCFAQAWLLHAGDVSSGFFVLAIAIHTFYTAVHGKRIGHKTFTIAVIMIWGFSYFLTGLGVGLHGQTYFVRAGAWCWVSEAYEDERLALHYIWLFLVQFGTFVIYFITLVLLQRKTKRLFRQMEQGHGTANLATVQAINRITKLMLWYPIIYVTLTLPLSIGRMWSYAHDGKAYGDTVACVLGSLLTSCGWVDSLLYTLTRQRLLKDTMPGRSGGSNFDNQMGSKGITHTRTVTVEGGQMMDTLDPKAHAEGILPAHFRHDRSSSPTGSEDPILGHHRQARMDSTVQRSNGLWQVLREKPPREDMAGDMSPTSAEQVRRQSRLIPGGFEIAEMPTYGDVTEKSTAMISTSNP